jgi:glycosyltransferase involved in cell wall biosynthesis
MEAVESIRAAKRPDVEIIVIDDGSQDPQTIRVIDNLKGDNITVVRQRNTGLARARNAGVLLAKGEFILPLDADNRIRPEYIEHGIRILNDSPRVGIVYGDAQCFGSRNARWTVGEFDSTRLLLWNYIDACAIYRKAVWEKNGGYDPNMPVMGLEDWDFWLGALANGWDFSYVPEVLFDYRAAEGSMITKTLDREAVVAKYVVAKYADLYRDTIAKMRDEKREDAVSVKKTAKMFVRALARRGWRLVRS